jgi:trehalose 6-phosphate synthase/phosphatase
VVTGAFPISIDSASAARLADEHSVLARAAEIREGLSNPSTMLLGVDRLDYTKGIDVRLKAYVELLEEGRLDPADTVLVQVATPSREGVHGYDVIRDQIELAVGRAVGDHGTVGQPPVVYLHQTMPFEELTALYRAADVMLVTPLRDGMNLVAKEYVAARTDGDGALVLSEFAGAAIELSDAYLVNPYDADGVKRAIMAAATADPADRRRRMRAMREQVMTHDVHRWAEAFLDALESAGAVDDGTAARRARAIAPAPDPLGAELRRAVRRLAGTAHLLVASDFDGTLAPIVSDPGAAAALPDAIASIRTLAAMPSTTAVVVSGRALHDLTARSGLPASVRLIGSHGAEPDGGSPLRLDDAELYALTELRRDVAAITAGVAGVILEDKPAGVAVHVRNAAPDDARQVSEAVTAGPGQRAGVQVTAGKAVVELSVVTADKGRAVDALRRAVGATATLFVGDDHTDESVFAVLRGPDVGVKVGDGDTAARLRVADPAAVVRLFGLLVRERQSWLQEGRPPRLTGPVPDGPSG